MGSRRRKHWGWGFEDQQPSAEQLRRSAAAVAQHLGMTLGEVREPVALESLPRPRRHNEPGRVDRSDP
jgi:alkyldihydroxyacetonephosphate synthase